MLRVGCITKNYNNYLNWWKLNTSYIDLKQSALAINERFKTEVITEQQIENMWELDDFVSVQQKAELAKNEAELAKMISLRKK